MLVNTYQLNIARAERCANKGFTFAIILKPRAPARTLAALRRLRMATPFLLEPSAIALGDSSRQLPWHLN
jgi:hypothetical protein